MPDRYDDLSEYNWLMEQVVLHESGQALALGLLLDTELNPSSVLDVGAGPGIYLLVFKAKGKEVLGIDGAPESGRYLHADDRRLVDLRERWDSGEQYDLTLCIEVAEHLKPEYAETLVATIAYNTKQYVFFSAARPNQGGEGHYNEQTKEYWLDLFARYGFGLSGKNGRIMDSINHTMHYEHCHWLQWNGMLLERAND